MAVIRERLVVEDLADDLDSFPLPAQRWLELDTVPLLDYGGRGESDSQYRPPAGEFGECSNRLCQQRWRSRVDWNDRRSQYCVGCRREIAQPREGIVPPRLGGQQRVVAVLTRFGTQFQLRLTVDALI